MLRNRKGVTWTLEDIDRALIPFCKDQIDYVKKLGRYEMNRHNFLRDAAVKILCHPSLAYEHIEEAKLIRRVLRYAEKTNFIF